MNIFDILKNGTLIDMLEKMNGQARSSAPSGSPFPGSPSGSPFPGSPSGSSFPSAPSGSPFPGGASSSSSPFPKIGTGMLGTILESILTGAAQGSRTASRKIPGGLGGLLGATLAGALFGRKASSSTVRNAALLGAGAVAWNFYRKWAAAQKARAQQGTAAALYSAGQEDPTADLVVKSLIFAARSDGKIDEQERQCIRAVLEGMLPNGCSEELLQRCLQEPLDPAAIAEQVESAEQAEDVYRLSCSVISIDEFAERDYMDALAEALQIPRARQAELEAEAAEASQALLS